MKQLIKKEVNEKIRRILRIKVLNIHIFGCISLIYMIILIIYSPYNLYEILKSPIFFGFVFFIYLPLMVICSYDFIVKRYKLISTNIIKIIRILLIILLYVYYSLLGFLIAVGISFQGLMNE